MGDKIYQHSGNLALVNLLPSGTGKILDCGCGAGDNARLFRNRGWSVHGITISRAERDLAANFCESVVVADLEQGIPAEITGPYNVIVMAHILEHVRNPHVLLKDARRVLAPGGVLAVALPNVLWYHTRIHFLFGKF